MKKIVLISSLALMLFGGEFQEILQGIDKGLALQAKSYEVEAKKRLYEAAKGMDRPTLDASLIATRLKDTPTMYLHLPGLPVRGFPMGTERRYEGEISISYPLFSGFAITNMIEKSRLEAIKAQLKKKDLRRRLYLKAAMLYGGLFSLQKKKKALIEAKKALEQSYAKARGFYDQGLIALSDLYNIEAKLQETDAQIEALNAKIENFRSRLRYLSGIAPKADELVDLLIPKRLDPLHRSDIVALQEALEVTKKEQAIVRSKFYPKVGLKAAFRRFGKSLALDGDGFRNADESYVGASVAINLYHGGSDQKRLEALRYKELAQQAFLKDYINQVMTNLESAKIELKALKASLKAAQAQVKAAKSYYELTLGRYKNQLASADELSRSIASLAKAKGQVANVKAKIFVKKSQILLLTSLDSFIKGMR